MGQWYAGVVHSHTTNSDGKYTPTELVRMAEEKKLDFLMITDHDAFCEEIPESEKVLVIPGTELSIENRGHTNIWGVKRPFDNFRCKTYEDWENKMAQSKENGATTCINHPLCSNCGWMVWPLEPEKVDCVEIWNSPQHSDNMRATAWWQDELRKGKIIPVVGGSDFHRSYGIIGALDEPVTCVYAEECTTDAILKAIRDGHTTIAPKVGGQMIELRCGEYIIGDTVPLSNDTKVEVRINCLKKGQTLKVIGNKGVLFEHKCGKTAPYIVTLPVKDSGFICAQVEYTLNPLMKIIQREIEKIVTKCKDIGKIPPFIYSQTGAVYFK